MVHVCKPSSATTRSQDRLSLARPCNITSAGEPSPRISTESRAPGTTTSLTFDMPLPPRDDACVRRPGLIARSEEHTSELQSLMRISYAVFCLKNKKEQQKHLILRRRQNPDSKT